MVLLNLSPRLQFWRRRAFDMRERRDIALATIQTYLNGKGLSSAEVTTITTGLSA